VPRRHQEDLEPLHSDVAAFPSQLLLPILATSLDPLDKPFRKTTTFLQLVN